MTCNDMKWLSLPLQWFPGSPATWHTPKNPRWNLKKAAWKRTNHLESGPPKLHSVSVSEKALLFCTTCIWFIYPCRFPNYYLHLHHFLWRNQRRQPKRGKKRQRRDRPFYLPRGDPLTSPVWVAAPEAWSFFKLLDSEPLAETASFVWKGVFHRAGAGWVGWMLGWPGGWVELMMGWLVDCFLFFSFFFSKVVKRLKF